MNDGIETRLVYGFLGAGKTTYIRETIQNDFFDKYGSTLILCFEQGEEEYDTSSLSGRRTLVRYYDGTEDVGAFCSRIIEETNPDRIYVEMNTMMDNLRSQLPGSMKSTFAITLIDWSTMPVYFRNFRQMFQGMVTDSHQVIFRGCPSRELLVPYSQPFRLMNQTATYLRQDPMGYHERAFDRYLPFSLEKEKITISEENYLPFWLDAFDHPKHYQGKTLLFVDPLELRRSESEGFFSVGRVVMVCCMADLQFMSLKLDGDGIPADGGWVTLEANARVGRDEYGRPQLQLRADRIHLAPAPNLPILDISRLTSGNMEREQIQL